MKLGFEGKLYYGAAGSLATNEMTNVRDITVSVENGEADVTTRASNGWKATAATLKSGSIEWEMIWEPGDAGFDAIKNAYFNNTAIALAALDGADGEGLDADFSITKFSRSEPLEDAMKVSVTAKPTQGTGLRAPRWKE